MDAALLDDLRARVPADHVLTSIVERDLRAHDWWSRRIMQRRAGEELPPPAAVVAAATRDEVADILRWADEHQVAVVPYGAGTGVCGGALPVAGAITLDLKGLNRIGDLDEVSGTIEVEPGVILQTLEDHLQHRGWTLGHFPSSIHCSTVGGFLAVRSAGQESSFYGKLEDAVVGLEAVLADGTVFTATPQPQSSSGPDLKRLFLGGEGTTGVITHATLRVWPKPATNVDRGYLFPDVSSGLAAARALLRTGLRPHVFRLYDQNDTALVFSGRGMEVPQGCLTIVGCSGDPDVATFVADKAREAMLANGATDLGPEPGEYWRSHRHSVSYRYAEYMKPGGTLGEALTLDTMEIAGLWRDLDDIYWATKRALEEHVDLVLAHVSHVYPEGACIYYTLGAVNNGDEAQALARYDAAWEAGQRAALAAGATLSHHHGVGLLRAGWLPDELGPGGWELLNRVKDALDPDGRLNPGKLGLGGGAG